MRNPWLVAIFVPIVFLVFSGIMKWAVRGDGKPKAADWYLGIDCALASLSAGLVNITDLMARPIPSSAPAVDHLRDQIVATVVLLVVVLGFLLMMTVAHPGLEKSTSAKLKIGVLNVGGPLLGALLLCAMIATKGV